MKHLVGLFVLVTVAFTTTLMEAAQVRRTSVCVDYARSLCPGARGPAAAVPCLKKHLNKLSPACRAQIESGE